MGLFGLFYATFCLGCKGVLGVQNFLEDEDHKTRYRNDEILMIRNHILLMEMYKDLINYILMQCLIY